MIPTKVIIEAEKNYKVTDEDVERLRNILIEENKKAEEQTRRSNSREFMNRTYNL